MDTELTALAASGATTLVSLMVTDSWAHARDLVRGLLSRAGSVPVPPDNLDEARTRLLAATNLTEDERSRMAAVAECQNHLHRLAATGSVSVAELRALTLALQQLASASTACLGSVHNEINGGVHHAPAIQSGRITGLTLYAHPSSPEPDQQQS